MSNLCRTVGWRLSNLLEKLCATKYLFLNVIFLRWRRTLFHHLFLDISSRLHARLLVEVPGGYWSFDTSDSRWNLGNWKNTPPCWKNWSCYPLSVQLHLFAAAQRTQVFRGFVEPIPVQELEDPTTVDKFELLLSLWYDFFYFELDVLVACIILLCRSK